MVRRRRGIRLGLDGGPLVLTNIRRARSQTTKSSHCAAGNVPRDFIVGFPMTESMASAARSP
jgi:hypothetical protein